jgi:hypothetical protein
MLCELALLHGKVQITFLPWYSNGKDLVLADSLTCGCEESGKRVYLVSFVSIGNLFVVCPVTTGILPIDV